MLDFRKISEDLFNKINGRFSSVSIGDADGTIITEPTNARFFDFTYEDSGAELGKVSVSLNDSNDTGSLVLIYSKDFVENENELVQSNWYSFLKELRIFAKKRLLNFEIRDITKSNLQKKDYKYLAQQVTGDENMNESKLYGTNKISYQDFGASRIMIKHTESVNPELGKSRTRSIGKIYIESNDGERFLYPYKHLTGARAMARHVSEGGKPFDDFGTHITGLSEELNKLRKFKSYMGRSAVMAESLGEYMDVVQDRIKSVKKTVESLQKQKFYAEAFASFEKPMMEDVPEDVAENWIDQLTIKQFNEELKDVFPYIYNLVSEATKAKDITAEDILGENDDVYPPRGDMEMDPSNMRGYEEDDLYIVQKGDTVTDLARKSGMSVGDIIEINGLDDNAAIQVGQELRVPGINQLGASPATPGATRGIDPKDNYSKADFDRLVNQSKYEDQIESAFEEMMGQFAEGEQRWKQTSMDPKLAILKFGKDNVKIKKGGLRNGDDMVSVLTDDDTDEGNAYAHAVKKAKMDGKKKGDKVDGPDGDEITLEKDEKTPLGEFILSYFDRDNGQFPKGETAVLTMVEKDYGEQYITPAKKFIEMINNKVAEVMGYRENESQEHIDRMKGLAGIK
jgi:murein DD-endopeptidase MepM/ murein hydrolase activator NlpD